jgi:hypothetical protein
VSVAEECLRLCDSLVAAAKIDLADPDQVRVATCLCLVYFVAKIQRVTRAALSLILAGQGIEAMSLIREQNDFVMALNYYHKHPDQAQLFMVSQAIVKRNFAKQIMEFDDKAAKDPKRIAQLAEREKDVAAAYRLFPGIRRIKGKSGKSKSPVYVDWSEPSSYDVFADVMDGLVRKRYADRGEAIDEATFKPRLKKIVDRAYFMRNTYMSQAKHGTAADVGASVDLDDDGKAILISHQVNDPNQLAFHFIMNAMPPLLLFRDYVCPGACEEGLGALGQSYQALREELNITDDGPDI